MKEKVATEGYQPGEYIGSESPKIVTVVNKIDLLPMWQKFTKSLPSKSFVVFAMSMIAANLAFILLVYSIECGMVTNTNLHHPDLGDESWNYPSLNPFTHPICLYICLVVDLIALAIYINDN